MNFRIKKIIYLFFFFVGGIHIYHLQWWYKTVMNDYNPTYEKLKSIFESEIRPSLTQDLSLCYRDSDITRIPCSFCEKILQEKAQNQNIKSNITFREEMPYSVEVRWDNKVGLIPYRFVDYRLEKNFQKICPNKSVFKAHHSQFNSREDYAH